LQFRPLTQATIAVMQQIGLSWGKSGRCVDTANRSLVTDAVEKGLVILGEQ
jgi:hypothetical protein